MIYRLCVQRATSPWVASKSKDPLINLPVSYGGIGAGSGGTNWFSCSQHPHRWPLSGASATSPRVFGARARRPLPSASRPALSSGPLGSAVDEACPPARQDFAGLSRWLRPLLLLYLSTRFCAFLVFARNLLGLQKEGEVKTCVPAATPASGVEVFLPRHPVQCPAHVGC